MQSFANMGERHAFGLEAIAEMTGKLLQAAYERASRPSDPADQDRAILLFDRLSRGFRLTVALEAKLDRDRRQDARRLHAPPAPPGSPAPPRSAPAAARTPVEQDWERDVELDVADVSDHLGDLRRMVAEDADILDPDGQHAATLDRWAGAWGDVVHAAPAPQDDPAPRLAQGPRPSGAPPRARSPAPAALRRASG